MTLALDLLSAASTSDWGAAKAFVGRFLGVSHDALHVVLGVTLQLVLAGLFRTSVARLWPWGVVFLAELANEWSDLLSPRWPSLSEQLGEGAKDLALTMFLPTALLLAARFAPQLFQRKPR